MKRKIYLFIAWLHEYFKHPLSVPWSARLQQD